MHASPTAVYARTDLFSREWSREKCCHLSKTMFSDIIFLLPRVIVLVYTMLCVNQFIYDLILQTSNLTLRMLWLAFSISINCFYTKIFMGYTYTYSC